MIKRKEEQRTEIRENLRGGFGALEFRHIFEKDELSGKAKMFAKILLLPGQSIGEHAHGEEGEIYIVEKGVATVTENGSEHELFPSDTMWTTGENTHSIKNKTEEELLIYAIILP